MRGLLLLLLTAAASAAGPAAAQTNPTLYATVTDTVHLRHADGRLVQELEPGTYTIRVDEDELSHNFHLTGPGIDLATPVAGSFHGKWTVTLGRGLYEMVCDDHAFMYDFFTVGDVLQVRKMGLGRGVVTVSPGGLSCDTQCVAVFERPTSVTLSVQPSPGSRLVSWSGCAAGGSTCTVDVTGFKRVTVELAAIPPPPPAATLTRVKVAKTGRVRKVTATLQVVRPAAATATLVRAGKRVASRRASLAPGRRSITVRVPRRAAPGRHTLRVRIAEPERTATLTRAVRLPR